ncbi:Hsp20/alpha crystallin family protein [Natrinema halophilum]|uniref:Hsp20/alpha crystallin family protein n=1 Tax=Natrinema halophilum TaxID=1699371 RepID=A0A7D5KBX0_9EURY|nr:Hsp20/alpha crystallin family protein [Natrinema halophilum]QLG48081.1 Hsp20/alpha crystallin family protein [Natrinema halophilum]
MSDINPDDDRDESDDDRTPDDRFTDESGHWLSSLLSALESLDSGSMSRSGRRRGDRTMFDYDISIQTGDDLPADDSPFRRESFGERRNQDDNRSRKRRIRSSTPSTDHNVATRSYDDEMIITADIDGADPDDVTVGFDDSALVIAVEEVELDRIEVPWRETTSQATINNGVLTVQIGAATTTTEGNGETEDDE